MVFYDWKWSWNIQGRSSPKGRNNFLTIRNITQTKWRNWKTKVKKTSMIGLRIYLQKSICWRPRIKNSSIIFIILNKSTRSTRNSGMKRKPWTKWLKESNSLWKTSTLHSHTNTKNLSTLTKRKFKPTTNQK